MKIWIQSGSNFEKDARVSSYLKSLQQYARKIARPDTVVNINGIDAVLDRPDLYRLAGHIQSSSLIRNAWRAQQEGYDAFVQTCTLDPAAYEIREVLDIPAVFVLECSAHLACLLAPRFSFLTHNESLLLRITEKVREYGLGERMTPGACLNLSHKDFNLFGEKPAPYLDLLVQGGRKVIAQGANIILVSGNMISLFLAERGVREIDGVPVLDMFATALKFGEFMADLRKLAIVRSRKGLYAAPSKGELKAYLKYLGV